jgi:hypothetical protein
MNVQSLLDQLLSSGQSMLSGIPGNPDQPAAPGASKYANFATRMLTGGVLGLLPGGLKTHLENQARQALAAA